MSSLWDQQPGRGSDQSLWEAILSNLLSCLQAVQGSPSFPAFLNSRPCWGSLGDAAVWESFCSCNFSPIFLYVTPIKRIGSQSWSLVLSSTWVSCGSPVWSEQTCVLWIPRKSFATQHPSSQKGGGKRKGHKGSFNRMKIRKLGRSNSSSPQYRMPRKRTYKNL